MTVEARDRNLTTWFERIRSGQIRLPRFQRFEAWSHHEVGSLLETILRGLPAGAVLVLEVGATEQFISRAMKGAPTSNEKVNEQLLDGQQRLTAVWRSFNNDYSRRTYFVSFEPDDDHQGDPRPVVTGVARYQQNGNRYPLWADEPREVHRRGMIPLYLCRPGDVGDDVRDWCKAATDDADAAWGLSEQVAKLRQMVVMYNIPFLSLPATTPKDVALDVFIKMNTSSVKLSAFDIVVAQLEEATGESLHDLVGELRSAVPRLSAYRDPEDVVLDVAALREDRPPNQASYQRLDLHRVADDWDEITAGLAWTVEFLEAERIFDAARLPSIQVLPVLAALKSHLPAGLDELGNARILLRKYLWRAFLTPRYEQAAAGRSLQDFRGLRDLLAGETSEPPIFDEQESPLPDLTALKLAGWPKTKEILARGILAVSIRAGGLDLADGTPAGPAALDGREYHHLFPDSILQGMGGLDRSESFRALNCALISWSTNRNIGAKAPLRYLLDRVQRGALGEPEVRARLLSQLVPYDELAAAGYENVAKESIPEAVQADYQGFLQARAELVLGHVQALCAGQEP